MRCRSALTRIDAMRTGELPAEERHDRGTHTLVRHVHHAHAGDFREELHGQVRLTTAAAGRI